MNESYRTAVSRISLPVPTRHLMAMGELHGDVMDYGCGKCHDLNNLHFKSDGYDPFHRPRGIKRYQYDIIICNYVLNCIPYELIRVNVLRRIQTLLKPDGKAFISVRTDNKKLNGFTSRKTWQGLISLNLPCVKTGHGYKMYLLIKDTPLDKI